ncbi:helix-turn-helix domain-containing protein [Paenibacillus sp. HB172176]|uniref:AraC family transcriptional regulator n=1 Tax=Paenibacillus sp. HB172176 TaxID=2493690 RepID=UPI00143BD9EA|nr:helix-turn-helix domain-containing protein [Paenibacillus sp. HB172176]
MKLRSPSYLMKLMLLSIVIGTVPVILLGSFAYYNSSQTVQDKVNAGNKLLLQQMQMRAEQTLKTIDNSATQLLQSPSVTGAFQSDITKYDFQLVHELYEGISRIQTYELGIKDVFLYSLSKNWIVSSEGVNEYSDPAFRPQLEAFSLYKAGSFWTSGAKDLPESYQSVYFVKKYPINSTNPTGIICVVLSSEVMKEMDAFLNGKLGSAFILDSHSSVIVHKDRKILGSSMLDQSYMTPALESKELSGQYAAKQNGEDVTVTYRKSTYNGWSYVSIASNDEVNAQNKIIGWITLLVCVSILLVTLLVAWFGSNKMYRPIQSLYSALKSIPVTSDQPEANGELQVIGERVDYLIRNQSLIMNELKGQQIQLKEFFMHKLLSGTIPVAEFEEKLSLYGLEQLWSSMIVVAIQIDSLKNTRFEEANRDLLMFAIGNIVGELVVPEQRLSPIVLSDYQVTLLGSDNSNFKSIVFNLCDEIQKAVYQYLNIKVSIGISRAFQQISDSQQALHEAMTALKYRVGLGQESILFIEDVQPQKINHYLFPHAGEQALFDSIRSGNEEQSATDLHSFIEELFQPEHQHADYQLSVVRLLVDLLKFGQELQIPMDHLGEDEAALIQSLFKIRDKMEMETWFWMNFAHPYLQELGSRRESQYKQISDAVMDIIKREFDSELTLEECSARINYHPHYVSRVFRQETGINFGDYLTQYRIDMAKKWLKESDMKVLEIAERLQYNNSANFIRSFRKIAGMTPGQYREHWKASM